jgi:DNA-binding NtrC family response regulator
MPGRLLQLHRHSLIHVLIMGGSPEERRAVALAFHGESPMRSGPLVRIDCATEEPRLCRALQSWIMGTIDSSDSSLMAAERGTLYLDHIDSLSSPAQRLLLAFVTHHAGVAHRDFTDAWGGRLVCGSAAHLGDAVEGGRFLAPLYDCLDKARIELDSAWQGGVA